MKERLKIFLCDFVHDYSGMGTFCFPLNIGYLSAYIKKYHEDDVDITLYKYPTPFLEKIKKDRPDLVGFSNYTWNQALNRLVAKNIKLINANIVTVFGGPNFDTDEIGVQQFFNHCGLIPRSSLRLLLV